MIRQRFWLLGLIGLFAAVSTTTGADIPTDEANAQALAAQIDKRIAAGWSAVRAEAAPLADDAEFLRRIYLDLAGRIPSVAEARTFLDDATPDKRRLLVQQLLANPRYVTHFADVYTVLLMPEANTNLQARFLAPGFKTWIRQQLAKNAGYDQMVRELMTTPLDRSRLDRIYNGGIDPNPLAYYLAKGATPENLAAGTARVFLGIRLECAQCHNHPFASWKREQFWGYAAFFAGIQRQANDDFVIPTRDAVDKRELAIPGTDRVVQAAYPDGSEPAFKFKVGARITLADWMTAPENPYFARAAANRLWFYFFGRGLVDPVDDMVGGDSKASHPELLDELTKEFAANKFDLKFLIRAITASKAYQLTSIRTHESQDDPRLFARMALRGLSPEQLFDSVAQATGYREPVPRNARFIFRNTGSPREEFLNKFANQSDQPTEHATSILQALTLMNGRLVTEQTSLEPSASEPLPQAAPKIGYSLAEQPRVERSKTLTAILDSPFMDTPQRIETLFLATLSRKPKRTELERAVKFIDGSEGADKEKARQQALADIFWVLLNSGEFYLNH